MNYYFGKTVVVLTEFIKTSWRHFCHVGKLYHRVRQKRE